LVADEGARDLAASGLGAVVEEQAPQVTLPRLAQLVEHVLQLPTGRLGEIREDRLIAGIRLAKRNPRLVSLNVGV
jgi:hypothetical protein